MQSLKSTIVVIAVLALAVLVSCRSHHMAPPKTANEVEQTTTEPPVLDRPSISDQEDQDDIDSRTIFYEVNLYDDKVL
ncbi:unnamed protein product [Mesocestoides corti]|uniref:Secreted protein n=1 Tax=Mesocestoides corti TaxID=53468 RepID=A0A0R3U5I7_MESCO|nr:unnamed protein product [Mesocestoides corti]